MMKQYDAEPCMSCRGRVYWTEKEFPGTFSSPAPTVGIVPVCETHPSEMGHPGFSWHGTKPR